MKVLVTGGAGFIGSAVVRFLINETDADVTNIDKLTYAANLSSLESVANSSAGYLRCGRHGSGFRGNPA